MPGYSDDLSFIHDAGYGHFARGAAAALLPLFRRRGIARGLIVDLGCGSGAFAREAVDAGYRVLGVDLSPGMVELARKRVPEADFRVESVFRARIPPCAAAVSIGECLGYRFDDDAERRMDALFRRVHDALAPGGIFAFDLLQPGHVPGGAVERYRLGDGWAVLVRVEEDAEARTLSRRVTSFVADGACWRRTDETHRVRLYPAAEIADRLRRAGFRVRTLRGYGPMRFTGTHVAFLASKPR